MLVIYCTCWKFFHVYNSKIHNIDKDYVEVEVLGMTSDLVRVEDEYMLGSLKLSSGLEMRGLAKGLELLHLGMYCALEHS